MTRNRAGIARAARGLAFICLASSCAVRAQVRTEAGLVEGSASADGKIQIFKGIPYAAPPVGPLRWRAPQAAEPWPEEPAQR